MFIIADEDMPVVEKAISLALTSLANSIKKSSVEVDIGDGLDPMVVTGYWVVDTIRIDIRIKK